MNSIEIDPSASHASTSLVPPNKTRTRSHPRVPLSSTVDLWVPRTKAPVKARNISAGGLFLDADPLITDGAYLTVRVRVPGEGAFTALCRVTRRVLPHRLSRGGIALEFLDVGPKQRGWLTSYVERSRDRDAGPSFYAQAAG